MSVHNIPYSADDKERTGYRIAKEVGYSWQVIKIRLVELRFNGKVTMRELEGARPCFLWRKSSLQPPKEKRLR